MNLGFQDAFNLAWKLAHAISHGASEALLDSYGFERRGAVQEDLVLTDAIYRGHYDDDHSLPHWVGKQYHAFLNRFETMRERERRRMAQLDVGYRQSPIVSEHDAGHPGIRKGREHPGRFGYRAFHRGPPAGDRLPQGRTSGRMSCARRSSSTCSNGGPRARPKTSRVRPTWRRRSRGV